MASGTIITSGSKMELLWTNPSPSSNFAAQTVSLDLSSYDAVFLKCYTTTDTPRYFTCLFMVDGNIWTMYAVGGAASNRYNRLVTVSDTGLVFAGGYSNGTAGSAHAIPIEVYGVKGLIQ